MPEIFNQAIEAARFSMGAVYAHIIAIEEYKAVNDGLMEKYTAKELASIFSSLIRFSYFIEPVKQPTIDSTKFAVRWSDRLEGDPRFCTFEDSTSIFKHLLSCLVEESDDADKVEIIKLVSKHNLVSYELNTDYKNRLTDTIHTVDNIHFFWDEFAKKTYLLRKYLLNPNNHNYTDFFKETYTKISTKAFLTDRVLTGVHKTNREKRWECHPESVHFALRKQCLEIEYKLIEQICHFIDFPKELRDLLQENEILDFTDGITVCPITLEPLLFENFKQEVLNPTHGKASIQVGHIHPLKAGESDISGHTADNISWISSIGNRIQGDLSVDETRAMIFKIIENYRTGGLIE